MRTLKEVEGYEFAKGVAHYIFDIALTVFVLHLAFKLTILFCGFRMDDSDTDTWHRSGLKIHIDAKTGTEYLSDGHGGLIRREE